MRDNDLTLMFPEAKGCTTKAGADRRVARVKAALDENRVNHVVVQRPDGIWLPVAILHDRNSWMVRALCDAGFGVTN